MDPHPRCSLRRDYFRKFSKIASKLTSKKRSGQPVIAMDGPRLVPQMVPTPTYAQRPYATDNNSAKPNAYYPMTSNMTSIILHEDEENVKRFQQDLPRLAPAPPAQPWVNPLFEGIYFMMMMMLRYSSHMHTLNILVHACFSREVSAGGNAQIESAFEKKSFAPERTRFRLLDFVLLALTISTLVMVALIRCDLNQFVSEEHNKVVLVRQMKNPIDRVTTSEQFTVKSLGVAADWQVGSKMRVEGDGLAFEVTSSCDTIGLG